MATKKPAKQSAKKQGKLEEGLSIDCIKLTQGKNELFVFGISASKLWNMISINRRDADKNEGYQRVLPNSRVQSVANYISDGNAIPNSVLVALDSATYDSEEGKLHIPAGTDVGWVIDGQHRLAGAHVASEAGDDYELCVIALLAIPEEKQVEYFVTINREAKGVPTSLVLDLLNRLPQKRPGDVANERAVDLSKALRTDPSSPLYNRIVIDAPSKGQISLTNFVRKITPLVHQQSGRLNNYTFEEQQRILSNYFTVISEIYKEEWKNPNTVFFRTVGFGALMNVFERIFNESTERNASFTVSDVKKLFGIVADFDFGQWSEYGSGNKAEQDAAKDFLIAFDIALKRQEEKGAIRSIKL